MSFSLMAVRSTANVAAENHSTIARLQQMRLLREGGGKNHSNRFPGHFVLIAGGAQGCNADHPFPSATLLAVSCFPADVLSACGTLGASFHAHYFHRLPQRCSCDEGRHTLPTSAYRMRPRNESAVGMKE